MTIAFANLPYDSVAARLVPWINRAIEALWLLAVALIPIAFLDREDVVSEAAIAYVEVPKIALLRTLVGLMTILWLIEWGLQGRLPFWGRFPSRAEWRGPSAWAPQLLMWLRERPTRWLFLAVWFFLGSTLLSTLLSASFSLSLWGEIPGQDGYATYTVVAYVLLFAVIATHLKTRQQLWRLLGAVVLTGLLVGGYAVMQHFGHDPFNLTESTGGGAGRSTSTTGNAIFTAAVLAMTIPLTVMAATMSVSDSLKATGKRRETARLWLLGLALAGFWVTVLAIQLLGITYTLSRGPWMGTLVALVANFGMLAVFVGWGTLGRATVLLGIPAALTLAVVQWNVSISTPILYVGAVLGLLLLVGLAAVFGWRVLGRLAMITGVALAIVAGVILVPSWFDDDSVSAATNSPATASGFGDTKVAQRLASIRTYVNTGFLFGRGDTWHRSWELIRDRPWFSFDSLSFPWLRSLVGYGPDLFRYTYLLKSVPQGGPVPVEPDHAHNFFIHQAVEQGLFGFLSSIALFITAFLVGAYQLLRQRQGFSLVHKIILVGVLAVLGGRFLEMMVGVARVSDLTILWASLAILVVLPRVFRTETPDTLEVRGQTTPEPQSRRARRRERRRSGPSLAPSNYDWQLFWRLAIVAWLIGGIGVLTWVKSVNPVRASVVAANGLEQFKQGDLQASLSSLDRAIDLAPDVWPYHTYRGRVYFTYQVNDPDPRETSCDQQSTTDYDVCLARNSYHSNIEAVNQRPFYFQSRLELADSAFNLKRDQEAIRLFREVSDMVPNSRALQNLAAESINFLAEANLDEGNPEAALQALQDNLDLDNDQENSAKTLYLQGVAYGELDELEKAAGLLEQSLELVPEGANAKAVRVALADIYSAKSKLAQEQRTSEEN